MVLDPRLNAWRKDIADIDLADRLFAPHYAEALTRACGIIPAMVRSEPSDEAEAVSQLLPGEEFAVLDISGGWAWGYCRLDHRVGYVEAIELAAPLETTHIVIEAQAPVQAGSDPLSAALSFLPMGSRLHGNVQGAVLEFEGGFIPLSYLRPIAEPEADPVTVAQRLMGTLYLRGGRSLHGIDCSGLVQLSMRMTGRSVPRDTDMQASGLGEPIDPGADMAGLIRGDLVFWKGHVAIMLDEKNIIHANGHTMTVSREKLSAAVERIAYLYGGPTGFRRP